MDKEKPCSKCGEIYPLTSEYFPIRKIAKDGFDSWCKECKRSYYKEHYTKNKESISECHKSYYQKNKDRLRKRVSDYQKTEKGKEYRKNYYQEKRKEYYRLYYQFKKHNKERNNYI